MKKQLVLGSVQRDHLISFSADHEASFFTPPVPVKSQSSRHGKKKEVLSVSVCTTVSETEQSSVLLG